MPGCRACILYKGQLSVVCRNVSWLLPSSLSVGQFPPMHSVPHVGMQDGRPEHPLPAQPSPRRRHSGLTQHPRLQFPPWECKEDIFGLC